MNKNDLGKSPAFPRAGTIKYSEGSTDNINWSGMDIRTYIATRAMQGLLAHSNVVHTFENIPEMTNYYSDLSVKYAAALIAELSKNT